MPVLWRTWTGVSSKFKLVWSRLTLSWITIIYFSIAIIHCFVQIGLQANAFTLNASAANALFSLLYTAHDRNETEGFAVLSGGDLKLCYQVPNKIDTGSCSVVWNLAEPSNPSTTAINHVSTDTVSSIVASPISAANFVPTSLPSSTISVASEPTRLISTSTMIPILANKSPVPSPTVTITIVRTSSDDDDDDSEVGDVDNGSVDEAATTSANHLDETKPSDSPLQEIVEKLQRVSTRKIHEMLKTGSNVSSAVILVTDIPGSDETLQLSDSCVKTLIYPAQTLSNTKREDITLIGFQVWVLGLSLVALLNESIPHLFASMFTQLLVAVWTIVQIFQTEHFRRQLINFSVDSTCSPSTVLGDYWQNREMAEIASATLNGIVFVANAFLHYNLMKLFGWQTFKRVGASLTVNRVYKFVLIQSIAIQLALFFMVATAALWIDQLYNGAVGPLATLGKAYKAGVCIMFILLIPWLTLGWFTIRLEMRKAFLVFLLLNLVFIGLWAGIFDSTSFRWTFILWPFFAVMVCVSGTLMLTTLLLGVICRLNFGKGLPRYLGSLPPSDNSDEDNYSDIGRSSLEKVNFPDVEFLSRMSSIQPRIVITPEIARGPEGSGSTGSRSTNLNLNLVRTSSHSSHASSATDDSGYRTDVKYKRWVIE